MPRSRSRNKRKNYRKKSKISRKYLDGSESYFMSSSCYGNECKTKSMSIKIDLEDNDSFTAILNIDGNEKIFENKKDFMQFIKNIDLTKMLKDI